MRWVERRWVHVALVITADIVRPAERSCGGEGRRAVAGAQPGPQSLASHHMPIYELGTLVPSIHDAAFVHPDAVVIGAVQIGRGSSIWPGAVLRGDYGSISIGDRTSIQDGTVLHAGPGFPTIVSSGCVVGHVAHLEGCTLEDDALVGSGSVVLHHAVIGSGATVGANAVVPNRMSVPSGALAVGVPARIRDGASNRELIKLSASEYVANAERYRHELRRTR